MPSLLPAALLLAGVASAGEISAPGKGHASNPTWSADGSFLAFEVNDFGGKIEMYVVKMSSGNALGAPTKVTVPGASSSFGSGGGVVAAPAWHPDGLLIFEGSSSGGTSRLYFWQPGGASAAELLSTSQVSGDLSWPNVAPNGMSVAFVSDATGKGDLYVWDRQSNSVTNTVSSPFSEMAPRYDNGSGSIAFSRKNQGGEDLFTVPTAGGNPAPRVGGNGDQTRPVWAGDKVVFFSGERGDDHWDLVVSSSVGDKKTIARDVRLPLRAAPAVSGDSQWVAWAAADPDKASSIFVTSVDGARTVKIPTGLVAAGEPTITSSGGRTFLAFTALPAAGADWRALHVMDITGKL